MAVDDGAARYLLDWAGAPRRLGCAAEAGEDDGVVTVASFGTLVGVCSLDSRLSSQRAAALMSSSLDERARSKMRRRAR